MSRSKRTAQENGTPAPRQGKRIFCDNHGRLRTGWLLAASLCAYAAMALGLRLGLSFALSGLFAAWNINADTASRAPRLARALYAWQGSLVSLAVAVAILLVSAFLRRKWLCRSGKTAFLPKRLLGAAGVGIGASLAVAALCLVPDSSRLLWPLAKPEWSGSLPVLCAFSFVGVLAEEAFGKRVLYDGFLDRWGAAWATAVAAIFSFCVGGGYAGNVSCAVNVALMGVLTCFIYAGYGLWATVGFRWGWSVANVFLLGFGGGEASVYRLYGVSETVLTGGDAGPVYGLWTTLLLATGIVVLLMKRPKRA